MGAMNGRGHDENGDVHLVKMHESRVEVRKTKIRYSIEGGSK